jgi:hypothetical protein
MGINDFFKHVPASADVLFADSAVFLKANKGETVKSWKQRYRAQQAKALEGVDHTVVDAEGLLFKFPGNDVATVFSLTLEELAHRMVNTSIKPLLKTCSKRITIIFDDGKRSTKLKELEQRERDKVVRRKRPGRTAGPKLLCPRLVPSESLGHHVAMSDGSEPVSAAALYQFFIHHRGCRSGMKELIIDALLSYAIDWAKDFGIEIVVRTNRTKTHTVTFGRPASKHTFVDTSVLGEAEAAAFQVVARARDVFEHQAVLTLSDDTDVIAYATQMREWEGDSRLTVCVGTRANGCIMDINKLHSKTSHKRRIAIGICLSLLGTDYVRRNKLEVLAFKRGQTILGLVDLMQEAVVIAKTRRVDLDFDKLCNVLERALLKPKGPAIPMRVANMERVRFQVRLWSSSDWHDVGDLAWAQVEASVPVKESRLVVLVHPDHIGEPLPKRRKAGDDQEDDDEEMPVAMTAIAPSPPEPEPVEMGEKAVKETREPESSDQDDESVW